ncbi:unnamed protein product, partial [marine sediment metagenome]
RQAVKRKYRVKTVSSIEYIVKRKKSTIGKR